MRIVKTTHAKKGGKSKKKLKEKHKDILKERAVSKVMENITEQARKIEMDCLQNVLEKHLGRALVKSDVEQINKMKTEKGYILCYGSLQLGEVERQHHTDKKSENNYRVLFTPFETKTHLKIA